MEKLLEVELSKKQKDIAYKLYKNSKSFLNIHNLSHVKNIPFFVKFVLALGLNFCCIEKPSKIDFTLNMAKNLKRIAWRIHFLLLGKESELNAFDKFLIGCKKRLNKTTKLPKVFNEIFPDPFTYDNMYNKVMKNYNKKHIFPPPELIIKCKDFLSSNNLIVRNADKNAGVCVINKDWHDQEVNNHLHDLQTYIPSCRVQYERKMDEVIDKIKYLKIKLKDDLWLDSLLFYDHKPASFYILPKIHKKYTKFPPGRPISSTCQTVNRNVSALVDYILKPIMAQIPNVLLDTTHFLILLQELNLCKHKRYALVTFDIDSMYTNLQVSRCKKFCIEGYETFGILEQKVVDTNNLMHLLDLCLDFSFVKFNNEYFIQKRGIQMGNAASVSVANISAYYELKMLFEDKPEIVFNVRFVDDGFMIIDTTSIIDLDTWLRSTFQHAFLTFTTSYSFTEINFLDVNISLNENIISTSVYKKPMSKNMYLSVYSNHPKHLLRALPYSQAIRIKRICSDDDKCKNEIAEMFDRFMDRGYPKTYLDTCKEKLDNKSRNDLLIPRSPWLIMNFKRYHENLIGNMHISQQAFMEITPFYVVIPYYANVNLLEKIVLESLHIEMNKCLHENVCKILREWEYKIVYKNGRTLANLLNKRHLSTSIRQQNIKK